MERKERVKHYIRLVSEGHPLEEVRAQFRSEFKDVPAEEIAAAEGLLMEEGMKLQEVQQLCDVHAALFEGAVQQQAGGEPAGHPLFIFSKENEGLRGFIDKEIVAVWEKYAADPAKSKNALETALETLYKVDRHYARKENLFFPYLEKAGVTGPPKVMWGVDDEIRALIRSTVEAVRVQDVEAAKAAFPIMMDKMTGMITKEEEILKPLLRQHISFDQWKVIAGESAQIGFAFADGTEGASPSDAKQWADKGSASLEPRNDAPIQFPSGFFEKEELRQLLNTLPTDITFVGADGTVHFFSEQKNRVFPRTRTIVGRKVEDCHPPKSLKRVQALAKAFEEGIKDSEIYWIRQGEKFILIRYFAVRDDEGKYLGVLECTEEISELRSLEGEKTLMSE